MSLISPAAFPFHSADNFIHFYEEQFQTPLLFQALTESQSLVENEKLP